jgi:hypothetical protein
MDPLADIFDKLAEPFPPDAISWRVGSTTQDKTKGLALAYLDARDVMDRLDLVCGPGGWQNRYSHVGGVTVCEIGIRVGSETLQADAKGHPVFLVPERWIWKADGAGATDVEAEKGALSDAFKRAAVRFGIGRYLYSLPSPWVALEPAGRSYKIKESEYGRLRALLAHHVGTTLTALKSAALAKRDGDFEHFCQKIADADDLEALGAIGREIKQALPMLPAAQRDPLHDAYAARLDELKSAKEYA